MVVEPLPVVSMAAFHLAVVPGSLRANCLMGNVQRITEYIRWVQPYCLLYPHSRLLAYISHPFATFYPVLLVYRSGQDAWISF